MRPNSTLLRAAFHLRNDPNWEELLLGLRKLGEQLQADMLAAPPDNQLAVCQGRAQVIPRLVHWLTNARDELDKLEKSR
jgi:hypothetical protein